MTIVPVSRCVMGLLVIDGLHGLVKTKYPLISTMNCMNGIHTEHV